MPMPSLHDVAALYRHCRLQDNNAELGITLLRCAGIAGCKTVVLATPPRPDGSISPEVLYYTLNPKLTGMQSLM